MVRSFWEAMTSICTHSKCVQIPRLHPLVRVSVCLQVLPVRVCNLLLTCSKIKTMMAYSFSSPTKTASLTSSLSVSPVQSAQVLRTQILSRSIMQSQPRKLRPLALGPLQLHQDQTLGRTSHQRHCYSRAVAQLFLVYFL